MDKKDRVIKSGEIYQSYLAANKLGYTAAKVESDLELTHELEKNFADIEGQDYACQAVKEYLFGVDHKINESGPCGCLLFAGPPAVGKTLMAERIAKALRRPYLRLDMSNYNEKESFLDLFGLNPSYKSATPGELTQFVYEHPVSVVLLDEIEKCHANVRSRLFQIFEGGAVQDLCMQKTVSFRDVIIIMTTNAGRAIYDKSILTYNFSKTPQSTLLRALKAETDPESGAPYFSDALVSRFSAGRIIMFNKLRPEILHRIAVGAIEKHAAYIHGLYKITVTVDKDELAKLIIFSQGENADVRTVLKAVREFFEKNVHRVAKTVRESGYRVLLDEIACETDFSDASSEAKSVFSGEKSRILVYATPSVSAQIAAANSEKTEFIAVDKNYELKSLAKADLSAAIIDAGSGKDPFVKKLFTALTALESVPVYVYSRSKAAKSAFYFYTDNGATDCYCQGTKSVDFSDWLEGIVKGVDLSFITQSLFRANKVIKFETSYSTDMTRHNAVIRLSEIDVAGAMDAGEESLFVEERSVPDVKFSDVIGADEAKSELKRCIGYLRNHKKYLRSGVRIPRGVLLEGDPGTGKTMLAKALANEAGVPFIQKNATEFLIKWVGEGARAVREVFTIARKYAPCILFIDEIDAISRSRSGAAAENRHTDDVTNAFLSEMDGFASDMSAPVLVMAATNFSTRRGESELDEAFLRRFDRKIRIELPDLEKREIFLKGAVAKLEGAEVSENMIKNIAARSIGWCLADLNIVVQNAARLSDDGSGGGTLTDEVLNEAFETFTDGTAVKYSEEQVKKTAFHEAGHAVVAVLSGITPSYTTITARGGYGGYVYYGDEKTEYSKDYLLKRIRISLAGRASEVHFYGEDGITSGAVSDLKAATDTAASMVCTYGMDGGSLMTIDRGRINQYPRAVERMEAILSEQYKITQELIAANARKISAVAEALLEKNSLDGAALEEICAKEDVNGQN